MKRHITFRISQIATNAVLVRRARRGHGGERRRKEVQHQEPEGCRETSNKNSSRTVDVKREMVERQPCAFLNVFMVLDSGTLSRPTLRLKRLQVPSGEITQPAPWLLTHENKTGFRSRFLSSYSHSHSSPETWVSSLLLLKLTPGGFEPQVRAGRPEGPSLLSRLFKYSRHEVVMYKRVQYQGQRIPDQMCKMPTGTQQCEFILFFCICRKCISLYSFCDHFKVQMVPRGRAGYLLTQCPWAKPNLKFPGIPFWSLNGGQCCRSPSGGNYYFLNVFLCVLIHLLFPLSVTDILKCSCLNWMTLWYFYQ